MDLTRVPGFKRRPIAPIANGITETGKSPLPPSLSPSSPSSPSSSSSSSPGEVATGCCNEGKGHAEGSGASRVPGDVVSSTSASLALNTTTPPFTASQSSFNFTSPDIDGQRDRTETEIYDPFYPTDGEREGCVVEEEDEEEEEDEKYDPFDPTGSPASNVEEEVDIAETGQGARRKAELENAAERGDNYEIKEEAPSYSTDIFFAPPTSPRAIPLPLRKRLDWDKNKTKELSRVHERKVTADSDHSEIEEGEIVGAADRDSGKRSGKGFLNLPLPSVGPFLGRAKPERILRVLDGDSFVSLRAEGDWVGTSIGAGLRDVDMDAELDGEPLVVGVEDLRRKLVSRRKERYRSCPPSSLSPPPNPVSLLPPPSSPTSSIPLPTKQESKSHKSSKTSKERERRKKKVKECKAGEKEERKRKKRKEKEDSQDESREKGNVVQDRDRKSEKEEKVKRDDRGRSSRSDSRKRSKRRHSSPETLRSRNSTGRQGSRHSWSSPSEDRHRDKDRERNRDKEPHRDRERDREKEPDRDRERDRDQDRDRRRDYRDRDRDKDSRCRKKERGSSRHKSSKERVSSRISKSSRECHDREEERERDRERQRDRDSGRRRDGRPVVPPSIQDLNGSDLFAIKRTITVTTTTTTTTVPGSPTLAPASSCSPSQGSDKPHKRKKKRRRRSDEEREDGGSLCNPSLSPSRYQGYDSDPYSDKLEIDLLSLDGEALDSDYPSLEDSPLATQLLQPLLLSPKPKSTPKSSRHHPKKSRTGKKSELSSLIRVRGKGQSLLSPTQATSVSASILPALPAVKRRRKLGKDKEEGEKSVRKESGHSGKSKKLSGGSRKSKLQSKVSVLVREGVSSTTGASGASGKLGMELHGASGPVGVTGGPVVGGSIAVVFRRDNESRSPFLKPCSEPLSLGGRNKDPSKLGKRSSLAGHPSTSLSNAVALKSKKAKPSSTTSTSSSASSPSSSLATKRRRRIGKKIRDKSETGRDTDVGKSNVSLEALGGVTTEVQPSGGGATKSLSPHCSRTCPAPCFSSASSSSSTSIPPPSSSPPHTPPPLMPPSRETRESSPDSQTVDSSCKTPEPSFLPEDCPTQTTPNLATSSPPSLSNLPTSLSASQSGSIVKPISLDEGHKSLASPPWSSSSCGSAPPSLSLPTSSAPPSLSLPTSSAPPSLSLPTSSADPSSSSSSSVSSSSANKPPPPPPPPPIAPPHPWSLQTGVDCTAGGVLALTALLFKMEEANIASRAKAQEFIQATSQILSQANHNQLQQFAPPSSSSSCSSQIPPPPSLPPGPSPAQFILHSSLPMVGCTKTLPSSLHSGMSMGGGCAQTPPPPLPVRLSGSTGSYSETAWDNESKDPDKYLKKLHTQERAVEEVKLAIKPYYQRKDINKDDYKDILRKAVHKICHSRTGEINPVKVSNLVKLYVQRYKYFRKHGRKMDEEERDDYEQGSLHSFM